MLYKEIRNEGQLDNLNIHDAIDHLEGIIGDQGLESNHSRISSAVPHIEEPPSYQHLSSSKNTQELMGPDPGAQYLGSQLEDSGIIESMRDIAMQVSKLANKTDLDVSPYKSRTPRAGGTEPLVHSQQVSSSSRKDLDNLIKFNSSQPKELLLSRLIGGDIYPSNTAPTSPRKSQITPRKFKETVERLYTQKMKSQEKTDSLKYLIYQEERQQLRSKPEILKKSKQLAKKKETLPIFSLQRTTIEREKKNKKLEQMRQENEEQRLEKERLEEEEAMKHQVGANTKPLSKKEWDEKVSQKSQIYWMHMKKREEQNQTKYKDLKFQPQLNPKSMKILEKVRQDQYQKNNHGELKVEERLQMYPGSLQEKKKLLSETLKPSFAPQLSRVSKRMHHKSVDSAIKIDEMSLKIQELTQKAQQMVPTVVEFENDAVIEEEEKDGSDMEELERDEGAANPHVNELGDSDRSLHEIQELEADLHAISYQARQSTTVTASNQMSTGSTPRQKLQTFKNIQVESENTTTPIKSPSTGKTNRKARLSAFLTGITSNPESQKSSSENNNFFTFKEKEA